MSAPVASVIPPVVRTIKVSWTQEAAFKRFTEKFGEWWPHRSHSIGGKRVKRVVFETKPGGLIFEELDDGRRFQWGTITEWSPPTRVAFTFHPSMEEAQAQDVSVDFIPDAGGTELKLVSTGWERLGDKAKMARGGYSEGWGYILNVMAGRRTPKMAMMDLMMSTFTTIRRLTGKSAAWDIDNAKGEIARVKAS